MKVKTLLVVLLLANLTSCNLTSDLSLQSNSQDNIEELISEGVYPTNLWEEVE